jgi:hypothetical protein
MAVALERSQLRRAGLVLVAASTGRAAAVLLPGCCHGTSPTGRSPVPRRTIAVTGSEVSGGRMGDSAVRCSLDRRDGVADQPGYPLGLSGVKGELAVEVLERQADVHHCVHADGAAVWVGPVLPESRMFGHESPFAG